MKIITITTENERITFIPITQTVYCKSILGICISIVFLEFLKKSDPEKKKLFYRKKIGSGLFAPENEK